MRDLCHIKKIHNSYNSFWFSTILTMIFYSSYSRKLLSYKKIFLETNNDVDRGFSFEFFKNIFNKKDFVFDDIFDQIVNQDNEYKLQQEILEHINKNGYLKTFIIHHFFDFLNINYLILDYNNSDFYVGFAENTTLTMKFNKTISTFKLPLKIDDYVNEKKRKLNNTIPEYIIVNYYNDTFISNTIDRFKEDEKKKLNIKNFNIKIDGLDTFEKIIVLNNNKYILDSVSFDYGFDDSIIGIHCNNKKFIYDESSKLFSKEWTFINTAKKPKLTMLVYVLYESKKINELILYSSVNNLYLNKTNYWFNCFLVMIFKSFHSKKLLLRTQPFNDPNPENENLSLFFKNILNNNNNFNKKNLNNIIGLFEDIKNKDKLFKFIKTNGYPINNFLPFFFDKFKIPFLILDYYKKNFYIGFSENFSYSLDDNDVIHTKFKLPNNNDIDDYSEYLKEEIIDSYDYIPNYIIVNIHNNSDDNYINNFNDDYAEKLNFDYYETNIRGLKSFKDIIIFKGRKYKLDAVSTNNNIDNDKINSSNNSVVGINYDDKPDNKFLYNNLNNSNSNSNKDKYPCKVVKYNWNIKNKSYFYVDTDNCSVNTTIKRNKDTNNFSFKSGFRTLIYVRLIDDNIYESDRFDYISSEHNSYEKSSSSNGSFKSASSSPSNKSNHRREIALSPIIFSDDKKNKVINDVKNVKGKKKNDVKDVKEKKEKKVVCFDDKILNPKTNRCVLKTSKIGKELLKTN